MTGDLTINGKDAFDTWGVSFEDGALATLMTPPAAKSYIENTSRLEDGKRIVVYNPRYDSRDITLEMHLVANDKSDFLAKYSNFCNDVLKQGYLTIKTVYQPDVVYHCVYVSCSQYSQLINGIAKFSLKLTEANPANRTTESESIKVVSEEATE